MFLALTLHSAPYFVWISNRLLADTGKIGWLTDGNGNAKMAVTHGPGYDWCIEIEKERESRRNKKNRLACEKDLMPTMI